MHICLLPYISIQLARQWQLQFHTSQQQQLILTLITLSASTSEQDEEIFTRIWASIQFSKPRKIINVMSVCVFDDDDDLALTL